MDAGLDDDRVNPGRGNFLQTRIRLSPGSGQVFGCNKDALMMDEALAG
ncbi:hypothetical protein RSSM_01063 [Rhodopirellula sallentina SM41]|uniref:Uncharacterized protein n=1 Tax=Rhodopirellula sallentina SM41 TaxID=1263870 RepID=M5U8B0_9BACT|nr:hypothetical protein RSSM_01063 [Rhodopirellula sallentina SM41]